MNCRSGFVVALWACAMLQSGLAQVRTDQPSTPSDLDEFFRPPSEHANDFGSYRFPLKFYDGRPVKTAADWPTRPPSNGTGPGQDLSS